MTSPSPRKNLLRASAAAIVVAGLVGGGTYLVLAPSTPERIQAALPPLPDLTEVVPTLREKLTEAHRAATTGSLAAAAAYGRLLHANGFAAEAAQLWQILMREDSDAGRWPYYLALLRRDTGDIGDATRLLGVTVQSDPTYAPAWLQLGDTAFKSGQYDSAQRYYEERLRLLPGDPYARIGLARIKLQTGSPETAQAQLNDLVADHPDFASAHNLLAQRYRDSGDTARAQDHRWQGYQSGRFATAEDPWVRELDTVCFTPARLFVIGMVDFQTGEEERGRAAYERAVAVDPENPGNHELLGDFYRKIKAFDLARASLRRSIELAIAQNTTAPLLSYINLAALEREQGNLTAATEWVDQGIGEHPDSPELWIEAGLVHEGRKQWDDAARAYRRALQLSPHDTAAHFHLGELQLRAEQIEGAMTSFAAALVQQPTFAPALRYLLQYHLTTHQLAQAARYADTLLKAYWGDSGVRQMVAIYHLHQGRDDLARGRTQAAITQFQRGFELNPDDVDIAFELGTLQLAQGNFRSALPALEVLITHRPNDPRAHLFLAQAYLMDGRIRQARNLLENGLRLAEQADQPGTVANLREMLRSVKR